MTFCKGSFPVSIGLLLLFSHGAGAESIHIDSTPGFNFTGYKKYSWRVHPVFEKRPELAEEYSVGIELVRNAANQNLMARGFQPAQETPDFFITFLLTGKARQDIDVEFVSGAYGWGGWYGWSSVYYPTWSKTVVSNYVEGVLILDIVDARSNQLVWRASCRDDVRDWKERHKNVQKIINKALKRFPPAPKG
jgi:hypothetical protein